MVRLNRTAIIDHKMIDLWCLNRPQEGILHADECRVWEHSPAGGLLSRPLLLTSRLAADLTELAQADHIIQAAVALDVQHCGDTVLARHDLDDGDLPVLRVLTLVDPGLVITVQVAQVDPTIDGTGDKYPVFVELHRSDGHWVLLDEEFLDAELKINHDNGAIDHAKSEILPFFFAALICKCGDLVWHSEASHG